MLVKKSRRSTTDATRLYRWTNLVFGFPVRAFFIKEMTGTENIPREGPAILAFNHQSMLDHFMSAAVVMRNTKRMIRFLAKAELFSSSWSNFLFSNWGQIPVKRGHGDSNAIETAIKVLDNGFLFGIYPEGTRSHDGTLYKGYTGVARIALATRVPVIPVGITNSYEILPTKKMVPRLVKTAYHFGKPLDLDDFYARVDDPNVHRELTDHIMGAIATLLNVPSPTEHNPRAKRYDDAVRAKDIPSKTEKTIEHIREYVHTDIDTGPEVILDASKNTP